MKYYLIILLYLPSMAQIPPETEIFLFDLKVTIDSVSVENGRNISNNAGYDNQPSFLSNDKLLYTKTRNDQTDITLNNTEDYKENWISHTVVGSEYSPKGIPGTNYIAAVRLDTTGLQRLYKYDQESGESSVLLPDSKVGYFAYFNEYKLLTSVLVSSGMNLVLHDLEKETEKTLVTGAGRSLQKVPGTESMSYTVLNEENDWDLYLLDQKDGETSSFFICTLPAGVQDLTWLDRDRIVLGNGSKLFLYNILGDTEWTEVADLSEYKIQNITRVAVNETRTKLAIVAEPENAVD